jgi:hypothetical protein
MTGRHGRCWQAKGHGGLLTPELGHRKVGH